ncbi:MAG: NAD(P)H-hydrate dehydratase [Leuconostoc citreum]|uniref:NAD(P)H-hydrate dehydratase n=1 Tax=uncultured Leuconostoc sp. TaxID=173262 RepID=UPI00280446CF|nr:NAD(P)H-hydrate dehydratase [uncultured Leuconostoc sp.]MDU7281705.1 NAD(P)H-hydrate dehydratase [Leuconostoc citreum]
MKQLSEKILYQVITPRPAQSHKGTFGRVLIIGGTAEFGGAVIMNAMAAVYAGAGLVTVATDTTNFTALHSHLPEAMVVDFNQDLTTLIQNNDVILIGSGLGDRLDILQATFRAVFPKQVLIVDGSALTLLAENHINLPHARLVLTPHQMEWQRITGISIAQQAFEAFNVLGRDRLKQMPIVVLKQHHTQIYTSKDIYELPIGGPYQATGGMGDTLAGIIAGFAAQFFLASLSDVVLAAVYSHSAIADELAETQYIVLPTQISQQLPKFMKHYAVTKP